MNVTITLSSLLAYAAEQACAAHNAAAPKDGNGDPLTPPLTVDQYVQARFLDVAMSWAREHCRISGAAFILRFTAAEIGALKAAMAANAQLAAAAAPLLQGQRVELAGPLAQQGIAMLQGLGLLTAPRAAAMLAPPEPAEKV